MSNSKKVTLIEKIVAILELSESGKIGKFFAREKKNAERLIAKLEANKKNAELQHECIISDLEDQLVDAKDQVEDAKTQIVPEDVTSNAAMESFALTYWIRIATAKAEVKELETLIKEAKESHAKNIKDIDEQIAAYKERIAICTE